MILRRFTKSIINQNWLEVSIELMLIVLGVFFGLQVNNWNDARIAEDETKSYYSRLIEDLKAEKASRIARIQYYNQTYQHGESALVALEQSEETLSTKFLIDIYQTTQEWNYAPQRTTYDEMLSANIANIIPDGSLRNRIANYYVNLSASGLTMSAPMPFRDNLRYELLHSIQKVIRKQCGDQYDFQNNNILLLSLPETCSASLDPLIVSKAIEKLSAYDELENGLAHHLNILESKLQSLKAHLQTTDVLIKYMQGLTR
jgi:hypothetical protein